MQKKTMDTFYTTFIQKVFGENDAFERLVHVQFDVEHVPGAVDFHVVQFIRLNRWRSS